MTTKNIISQSDFNERIENGDFTVLEKLQACKDRQYYKVNYISASLNHYEIFVAVYN